MCSREVAGRRPIPAPAQKKAVVMEIGNSSQHFTEVKTWSIEPEVCRGQNLRCSWSAAWVEGLQSLGVPVNCAETGEEGRKSRRLRRTHRVLPRQHLPAPPRLQHNQRTIIILAGFPPDLRRGPCGATVKQNPIRADA